MRLMLEDQVGEYIRQNGGRFYIWADAAGISHESLHARSGVNYTIYHGDGFDVCIDSSIEEPDVWKLVFHRFPRPHIRALWNGVAYQDGSGPGGIPRREGGSLLSRPWRGDPN